MKNQTYISLLRGINVSGQKLIKMADLKVSLQKIGLENLSTYIQSGNLVYESDKKETSLNTMIQKQIQNDFGFEVPVITFSKEKLIEIESLNPIAKDPIHDPKHIYFVFLYDTPSQENLNKLPATSNGADTFSLIHQTIYLHCPAGYGQTKFNNNFFESKLKVSATTRNWKTVLQLMS